YVYMYLVFTTNLLDTRLRYHLRNHQRQRIGSKNDQGFYRERIGAGIYFFSKGGISTTSHDAYRRGRTYRTKSCGLVQGRRVMCWYGVTIVQKGMDPEERLCHARTGDQEGVSACSGD